MRDEDQPSTPEPELPPLGWLDSGPEPDYAGMRQQLDAQAALAATSYATVVDGWLEAQAWKPPPDGEPLSEEDERAGMRSDLRRVEEAVVATGKQISALAGTTSAMLVVLQASDRKAAQLHATAAATNATAIATLQALRDGQDTAARANRSLIILTGVLVALTCVLGLPSSPTSGTTGWCPPST